MSGQLEFGEEDRSATLRRAWELSLHLLASKVSKVTFESYVRPIQPLSYVGSRVTLGVASPFAREWLEKTAANAIRSALEFHLDTQNLEVQFVVLPRESQRSPEGGASAKKTDGQRAARSAQPALPLDAEAEAIETTADAVVSEPVAAAVSASPVPTARPSGRRSEARRSQGVGPIPSLALNDRYVFGNFVVGRSNRLAHAGAMAVASRPGSVYNPLFLYGGPGLGKTHLLQGIAHALRQSHPHLRVAYVSGEYFAQHYIASLREHATEDFRRSYREVDVWLVDDIQFIAGKEHTKEEFFYTFNSLYQSNKQIVIASDRSPRELNTMDERLRSRFQSGLIADIGAPELETRIAILERCRQRENAAVPDDVLIYIASAIQSNIRALEGALTKLLAYSSIMQAPVSPELAQSVLGEYFIEKPIRTRKVTIEEVVAEVAKRFGVTPEAIKGPSRNKDISLARQVAIYVCRDLLPEINTTVMGAAFGGRDHATIVYACQKLKLLLDADSELQNMVNSLIKSLSH
ncbi:MAG TPA: chromosomal replication initiator protein DnaA [Chthonomonadaceae bacterium]|nr:chromosomal replication initiator protein DnaA [Chthonomonadaceae bacterium]